MGIFYYINICGIKRNDALLRRAVVLQKNATVSLQKCGKQSMFTHQMN